MSIHKKRGQSGFALIEVMIAIVILAVGLLGLAALLAQLTGTTTQSRYSGTEVMLASEKLEDLNQRVVGDPKLTPGGSLGTPPAANFFDVIQVSSHNGIVNDQALTGGAVPAVTNEMQLFQRQWIIEFNPPGLPNLRRITVLVTPLTGTPAERAATFQTSTVRP
jgi:prepilin-type N-terminal cleavage/methylation domain-containing protein